MLKFNREQLEAQAAQARREWEEMDTGATSYAMRHRAEMRYLSLRALLRQGEPERVTAGGTPPRTAERWRAMAERARQGHTQTAPQARG